MLKKHKTLITWLSVGIIILLALAVRLPEFGEAGLWNDEAIVATVAEHPLSEIMGEVRRDAHPPLFFVIERFVRIGLGFDGWTEAGVRAISLFFGILSIIVIYRVGGQFISKRAGLMAAFLLAINPMHIHYSREGRNYSLLILLVLLAMSCVVTMYQRPSISKGFLTALIFLALVYTHSISFFILAPLGIMLLIPLAYSFDHKRLHAVGVTIGVSLIGLLPWLPTLYSQTFQISKTATSGSGPIEWVKPYWDKLFPFQIPSSLGAMSHGSMPPVNNFVYEIWWTAWFALGLSAILILIGWRYRASWREPWAGYLLIVAGLGSLLLLFIASWIGTPIYTPGRVDTIALPAFILLIASWIQATINFSGQEYSFNKPLLSWPKLGFNLGNIGLSWRILLFLVPTIILTMLTIKPIQHEIGAVRGTQNKNWVRYFSRYTEDGDIFMITGKWWTTLEYYLPRFDKDLHFVGFPSGREQHPNWLDWSVYSGHRLKEDADQVARKVARIAELEDSTVWVYPGRASAGIGKVEMAVLLEFLSKYMTPVTFEKHPTIKHKPYLAFRPNDSLERREPALEKVTNAADLAPLSLRHQYSAARILQKADKHPEAIVYFKRIINVNPAYKLTGFWIGFAYQKTGQSQKAIDAYNRFLILNPDHVQSHFNLAYELIAEKDCKTAVKHFNKVLELRPSYREAHLYLSRCYKFLGNLQLSRHHLKLLKKDNSR